MSGYTYLAGVGGAALGIAAGIAPWAVGNEIPEWTGDKLHPVQLGIIINRPQPDRHGSGRVRASQSTISPRARVALAAVILLAAVVCFTTVGRLWYVPGPLLIIAAGFLLAGSSRAPGRAVQ